MKLVTTTLTALALSVAVVGSAHAGCQTPTLELTVDQEFGDTTNGYGGNNSYDNETSFGIALEIPLSSIIKKLCIQELLGLKAKNRTEDSNKDAKAARAAVDEAKARQEEIAALNDKIELCSGFTLDTAPGSIKDFCGDLLQ